MLPRLATEHYIQSLPTLGADEIAIFNEYFSGMEAPADVVSATLDDALHFAGHGDNDTRGWDENLNFNALHLMSPQPARFFF